MKILSSICYLARQRCLYAAIMILNQIFVNYFFCGQKAILTFRNGFTKKAKQFSPLAIQSETLKDMAMHILRPIVKNIKKSSYYSVMADETTDIINKEQFVICIRWVDNHLQANEDLLGYTS